jgi:site-specific DNA recombinase
LLERHNLSENIRRGLRQKLRNGIWPNRPPVGYFNDRNNRCIAVQPEKALLVRKAFELYATGDYALHEVRERMEKLGLTSLPDDNYSFPAATIKTFQ